MTTSTKAARAPKPIKPRHLVRHREGYRQSVMRGDLHELLSRGLPDLCDTRVSPPVCSVPLLAIALGISNQAAYQFLPVDGEQKLTPKRAEQIIELSQNQKTGAEGFKPLTYADLWPFLS